MSVIEATTKKIYTSFVDYVKALSDCVLEQMPKVLARAEQLPAEAEQAQAHAESEIEALDFMKKPQALVAIAYNITQIAKIPAFIKTTIEGFKRDLQQLQEALTQIQNGMPTFIQHGETCAKAGATTPVACYTKIYGPIKFTSETLNAYSKWANRFYWKKKGRRYGYDYPLTHLVKDESQATH